MLAPVSIYHALEIAPLERNVPVPEKHSEDIESVLYDTEGPSIFFSDL